MMQTLAAQDVIRLLDLKPHPEGGHYRETWRADAALGERSAGTAIYFLLAEVASLAGGASPLVAFVRVVFALAIGGS